MKKPLFFLLALTTSLLMSISLSSCNLGNSNNSSQSEIVEEIFEIDLGGYVANIGNAKAIGISKKKRSNTSQVSYENGKNVGSRNKYLLDKDTETKKYIVMSTNSYSANDPVTDDTGLIKVSFTKIVTENVTTEIEGSKYVIAKDGKLSP